MCGICGIVGRPGAAGEVLSALAALEYRGYDSCGIAWNDGALHVHKAVGGVANLRPKAKGSERLALGHTRWATHGGVTEANAHPHTDCKATAAVVHNGVLLNHETIRRDLAKRGHRFGSETDSEVLAHLWEENGRTRGLSQLRDLVGRLRGTYSICILDRAQEAIFAAKEANPLWVAADRKAAYVASDPIALRPYVKKAVPLLDGEVAKLTAGRVHIEDEKGKPVRRAPQELPLQVRADRAGYEHFMLKEIHESASAINRLVGRHVQLLPPYLKLGLPRRLTAAAQRVEVLGAGTSHHAALLTAAYVKRYAKLPAEAFATPEYKDSPQSPPAGTLLVAMSQSGETLDTVQALRRLESEGHPILAVTNFPRSTIGRAADQVLPLATGLEVGVAATKTFLAQCLLGYLTALELGRRRGVLSDAGLVRAATDLKALPRAITRTTERTDAAAAMARELTGFDHVFLLGKDLLLPAAMEGALKLKEIAYQHAEASAAGELKHGPFALLTKATAVVFLLAPGQHEPSLRNSLEEVHARGAPTFVLAFEGAQDPGRLATHTWWLPATPSDLQPLVASCALHLLSYWVAKARALPIDRPRNLAKSVTVE